MHDHALLAAILADPDDDAPRLIYADWLEERGDPDRAEFIRLQCHLARSPHGPTRGAAEARQQELLDRYGPAWARPLVGLVREWSFERGFIESVGCDTATLLERGEELFRLSPIRSLRLYGARGRLEELGRCTWLLHVRSLDLGYNGLADREVVPFLRSAGLSSLSRLDLSGNRLGVVTARALLRLPWIRGLDALVLVDNPIPEPERERLRSRWRERVVV